MEGYLIRLKDNDSKQSLGYFTLFNETFKIMEARALELPYLDNARNISAIPPGAYKVVPRESQKYGLHFLVQDVTGRDYILIHAGNFKSDTRGCILLGQGFTDINGDGHLDITGSSKTIAQLVRMAPDGFNFWIYEP